MFNFYTLKFFYDTPDDSGGGALSVDDIDKFLKEEETSEETEEILDLESEKEEETEEEEPEKGKEKEKEEEKEEEEFKLDDEEEEQTEELVVPVAKKKILAKYPNLFKDFPYLETAYYADQAYKELLPTIDDAKEVIEKAQMLDGFERSLMQGDTSKVLEGIKNTDRNAFNKLVDNYLPTLAKVDKGAFDHIVTNVTRQTIMAMIETAREYNDEELGKAAQVLNKFAFRTSQIEPPKRLTNQENTEHEKEVQNERLNFVRERFSVVKEDLDHRIENTLKSTLDRAMDPKGTMPPYVKKNAVKDALQITDRIIGNDTAFRKQLDSLWTNAARNNFNRESMQRIRSAYLSKAKTVLPQIISKTRNEALRGLPKRTNNSNEAPKKGHVPTGRPASSSQSSKKMEIPKGMSTREFLMKD